MSVSEEPRPEELVAEAEGESLGEAKWAAMKTLEGRFPGLTAECVSFEVAEDPGSESPARVRAEVDVEAWRAVAEEIPEEPAERVRAIVGRVVHALGLHATVDIDESDDGSIWLVDEIDSVYSAIWLVTDDVIACAGKLINTDQDEVVQARRVR